MADESVPETKLPVGEGGQATGILIAKLREVIMVIDETRGTGGR